MESSEARGECLSNSPSHQDGGCQRHAPENVSSTGEDGPVSDVNDIRSGPPENGSFGGTVGNLYLVLGNDFIAPVLQSSAQRANLSRSCGVFHVGNESVSEGFGESELDEAVELTNSTSEDCHSTRGDEPGVRGSRAEP